MAFVSRIAQAFKFNYLESRGRIENPRVGGSIPSSATKNFKGSQKCEPFFVV